MYRSTVRWPTNPNRFRCFVPYFAELKEEDDTMGITFVALVLFVALVACWVLLPGSVAVTEAAYEPEATAASTSSMQPIG